MDTINVAIDGPSGAGKSTIARALSGKLGFLYVDTGALYRAVGYEVLARGVDVHDEAAVSAVLPELSVSLRHVDGAQRVFSGERDISDEIRTPEISLAASAVSALPSVRAFLLQLQKDTAAKNNVIMDGRDIGTVVLPQAQVKIFLSASAEDRAKRRYEELLGRGQKVAYEDVLADMKTRDYNDSHRAIAPLKPAEDAVQVDTTGYPLEKSIAILERIVLQKLGDEN